MTYPLDVIYGNIGFSGDNITILNGSTGLYFVQFAQAFLQPPAVILTQIYHGSSELDAAEDPKWSTAPQWGNTRDNGVLVGISNKEFKLITGDEFGNLQNRMFGFMAVGYPNASATLGYVDPRSKAAGITTRI
jgi:hypothetical protein